MSRRRHRPREREQRDVAADGISPYMLDEDGFVLPKWRHHVARLRERPQMSDIGEVIRVATSRSNTEGE